MSRIAVVIPCHDLGELVEEAVASVLDQTREVAEIVVVDDGSEDPATVEVLDRLDAPRTRIVRTPNRGLAAARNRGLAETTAELVSFLDADDRLRPSFAERAGDLLDSRPDLAFASCWLAAFGDDEWTWRPESCDFPALLAECTVATCALVRREAVEAVGGFDESMPHPGYEDWDLWISLVESGQRGEILPEVLFEYRQRAGSMSDHCTTGESHAELMAYIVAKHEETFRRHLDGVLDLKESEIQELLVENAELESRLWGWHEPAARQRRAEVERLEELTAPLDRRRAEERIAELRPRADELEHRAADLENRLRETTRRAEALDDALRHRTAEVEDLRRSWSWRLTAPLRAVLGLFRGGR